MLEVTVTSHLARLIVIWLGLFDLTHDISAGRHSHKRNRGCSVLEIQGILASEKLQVLGGILQLLIRERRHQQCGHVEHHCVRFWQPGLRQMLHEYILM